MTARSRTCDHSSVNAQVHNGETGKVPGLSALTAAQHGEAPKLFRRRRGKIVAGVAGGVADHIGIDVLWVRIGFTVLSGMLGAGALAYALLWIFVPQQKRWGGVEDSPKQRQQAIGVITVGVGLSIAVLSINNSINPLLAGAVAVSLVGAGLVWREADDAQRRRWRDGARSGITGVVLGTGGWSGTTRVLAGVALVVAGLAVFLSNSAGIGQVQFVLLAVITTLIGVAVLTVPWWVRLVRDLNEERRVRIRTEERAEIAAHLHDSVLQTLALIQKQADTAREVRRLARGQERQLRSWLYGPSGYGARTRNDADDEDGTTGPGFSTVPGSTLTEAVPAACGEVEDTFAITVQQVVVGDCPVDEKIGALVQAAREAMVNAAKHAGVGEVSVYAEVEEDRVHVFVRDRGKGFDPATVPGDRHGLADSIHGRMERHGGSVRLRTALGEGTELQLIMPRSPSKEART
ncbi:PspC domain-containing protein [Allokutzneria oryzae]|uniref:PspC domain-containing protein n=1 Tax=Allokutzneria oryzae TaxID=1378989 RepID=A0ABV6A385_9PSEU